MKRKVLQFLADQIIKKLKSVPNHNDYMFDKWLSIGFALNKFCIDRDIYLN